MQNVIFLQTSTSLNYTMTKWPTFVRYLFRVGFDMTFVTEN